MAGRDGVAAVCEPSEGVGAEPLAVVVALAAPLRVTVAPAPPAAGLIARRSRTCRGCAVAVKFKAVTLAQVMVTGARPG